MKFEDHHTLDYSELSSFQLKEDLISKKINQFFIASIGFAILITTGVVTYLYGTECKINSYSYIFCTIGIIQTIVCLIIFCFGGYETIKNLRNLILNRNAYKKLIKERDI